MAPETRALKERLAPFMRWETGLAIALVAVAIFGNSVSSQFFSSYNIFTLCTNIGDLAIIALPMTLIIITGEIDIVSVASILAVSAETLGVLWTHHWPIALIFVVCLAIGATAGLINGVLITRVGLPSLAVTIGTLTLYGGLAETIDSRSLDGVEFSSAVQQPRSHRIPGDLLAFVVGCDLSGARRDNRGRVAKDTVW